MKIIIVGSMGFYQRYLELEKELKERGHEVISPLPDEFYKQNNKVKRDAMEDFNKNLKKVDAILVANYDKKDIDNYIGINTLMEIGIAFNRKKKIFILKKIPQSCKEEFEAIEAIELNENLENIK
jgi:hypothetical protein